MSNERCKLNKISEIAIHLAQCWKDQEGFNAGVMDMLVEAVKEYTDIVGKWPYDEARSTATR